MTFTRRHALAALSLAAALPAAAWAQAYPSKQITLVVAYPAGGDTDALARVFAEKLSARLHQPVVVDNRPGASGVIGSAYVSRAPADGYTLLLAPSTLAIAQLVLKTPPSAGYDAAQGFTPIVQTGAQPLFLVAGASVSAKKLPALVSAAKSGQELAYTSPGSGSPMHILGEMFNRQAAVNFRHIPYRGVAPAVNDVLGGHVPLTWMTLGPVAPYLANGKMTLLAVADRQRSALAPDVPTLKELGYGGVEVGAWNGLFGPRGLSADLTAALNAHFNQILRMPEVIERMASLGVLPVGGAPAVLAQTHAADLDRFSRIIKDLGIQAD